MLKLKAQRATHIYTWNFGVFKGIHFGLFHINATKMHAALYYNEVA